MAIHSSKHGVDRTEQELSESPPENEPKLAGSSLDSLIHDTRAELRAIQGNAEQIGNTLVTDSNPDWTHQSLEQTIGSPGRSQVLLAYGRPVENLALTPLTEQPLATTLLDCVETIDEKLYNFMVKLEGLGRLEREVCLFQANNSRLVARDVSLRISDESEHGLKLGGSLNGNTA
jgi:hypothetical protein